MVLKERPTSMNKTVSSTFSSTFISCLLLAFVLCRSLFAIERQVVSGPLVVSESWPESTDLISWTRDVMRLEKVENASETAQAKAFFKWLRLFSKMATGGMLQAYEGAYGNEHYVLDAHKNLFVYGWGHCDTHSRIAEAAGENTRKVPDRLKGFACNMPMVGITQCTVSSWIATLLPLTPATDTT
jgi:hypothetical protein